MGKIRCIGENYILIPGYFAWSNPILENDEIREDFDRESKVEPIEETYKSRRAKDVAGEKGRHLDILV